MNKLNLRIALLTLIVNVFALQLNAGNESEIGNNSNEYRLYFSNGNLEEEGNWVKHRNVGEFKRYHSNGMLAQQFQFNQYGVREGVQKYFHENGQLRLIGSWKDGSPEGIVRQYNEKGELEQTIIYNNGVLIKKSIRTYDSPIQF